MNLYLSSVTNLLCSCIKYVCYRLFMRCWCYSVNRLIWNFKPGVYDMYMICTSTWLQMWWKLSTACRCSSGLRQITPTIWGSKTRIHPQLVGGLGKAVKYMTSYLHACFWRGFWVNFNFLSLLRHKYLMWRTKICCKVNKIKIRLNWIINNNFNTNRISHPQAKPKFRLRTCTFR